jgi:hypothetical protein
MFTSMPIKLVMHVARIVEKKTNVLGVGTETERKKAILKT